MRFLVVRDNRPWKLDRVDEIFQAPNIEAGLAKFREILLTEPVAWRLHLELQTGSEEDSWDGVPVELDRETSELLEELRGSEGAEEFEAQVREEYGC